MRVVVSFLIISAMSTAAAEILLKNSTDSKPFVDIDVARNKQKIQKIFERTATINILLKNYQQPEGIIKSFESIFGGNGNKSFVIFNFPSESTRRQWINECGDYLSNPGQKVAYYERVYQRSFGDMKPSSGFKFEEEFELERDPQAGIKTSINSVQVQEEFAKKLDKYRIFHQSGYIIFTSVFALEYYMGCLVGRAGTFLFIIDDLDTESNDDHIDMIDTTFSKAWNSTSNLKLYILSNKEIFSFDPFQLGGSRRVFGVTQLFDENRVLLDENLRNLNGYPFRIEMFWSVFSTSTDEFKSLDFKTFRGPDAMVAKTLTERMNLTMMLIPNDGGKFGIKYPNGTLTGALGNLQRRKSDIALTAFFMKDYETRAAEFTHSLYMDRLCLVVKKAGRIPSEMLPLVIFTENLWIAHVIVCLLIATIWMLLRSINNYIRRPSIASNRVDFHINNYNMSPFLARQSRLSHCMQIFVDTLMLYLSIPMRRLTRAQYERLFVASICLVSIIFVSIYQSSLATVFVRPLYFKDIDTLKKVDQSINNIYVKYSGFLTDVFPNDTSQLYRNLRNKMKHIETKMDAMNFVIYNENVATVTRESTIWLDNFLFFYLNILYIIDKECPKDYFLAYMVPTKSPFLKRINQILLDFHRYGLMNKWIDDFYIETEIKHLATMASHENVKNAKTLSLSDLKFPFYALFSGSFMSFIALVLEFILTFWRRRAERTETQSMKRYEQNSEQIENVSSEVDLISKVKDS